MLKRECKRETCRLCRFEFLSARYGRCGGDTEQARWQCVGIMLVGRGALLLVCVYGFAFV
jgi:hypothetical protein